MTGSRVYANWLLDDFTTHEQEELRGEQLSAVTFVEDYLQLWFDGPGINVMNTLTAQSRSLAVVSAAPVEGIFWS